MRRALIASLLAAAAWGAAVRAQDAAAPPRSLVRIHVESPAQLARILDAGARPWACTPGAGPGLYDADAGALDRVAALGLEVELVAADVARLVEEHRAANQTALRAARGFYDAYQDFAAVRAKLDDLAAAHPASVTKLSLGNSLEGRPIEALRIRAPGGAPGDRPAVLLTGCQHAREWITVMASLSVAETFAQGYGADPELTALLDSLELIVVPVANPDGYVHTWGPDRLWRKNRRNNGGGVFGVDLNRNWSQGWGENSGSSGAASAETYRGPSAFSEVETQRLRDFVIANPNIRAHLDVHNFSQVVLGVWGHTLDPAPRSATHVPLGWSIADAATLASGAPHRYGTGGAYLGFASGIMPDWAFGQRAVLSWTIELRDTGEFGFLLPPSAIAPASAELLAATKTLMTAMSRPLEFRFPQGTPATTLPSATATLRVDIAPLSGSLQAGTARLFTRLGPAGAFTESSLSSVGGGEAFSGTLPAAPCGAAIDWYIEAGVVGGGATVWPPGGGAAPARTLVRSETTGFFDDFETDRGWTVGAPGDTAVTGLWTRVDPIPAVGQPDNDASPPPGTRCYITGQGVAGGAAGAADVDGGATTLTSPAFSAIGAGEAFVSYARWLSNNLGDNPNTDAFVIQISHDGGQTWTLLERVVENTGQWVFRRWRIADFVPRTSAMRVRFVARDDDPGSIVEAGVDEFRVLFTACPGQPLPDLSGDGRVDSQDLGQLLGAWGPCPAPCPADLTGDGAVNSQDLAVLLGAWSD